MNSRPPAPSMLACANLVLICCGSADGGSEMGGAEESAPGLASAHLPFAVDTLATGLEVPWDLAFAPDGRIFVTERPGRIRVVGASGLEPEPWATIEIGELDPTWTAEAGLTGIALSPRFESTRYVYVASSAPTEAERGMVRGVERLLRRLVGRVRPDELRTRVYRFVDRGSSGNDRRVLIDHLPSGYYHAGGALGFGPDGALYVGTGDGTLPSLAQDTTSFAGKILRYRADGSVPADNPFAGSPVYALGFRNPQAVDWDDAGRMFAVDHGPSGMEQEGGRWGRDELNHVVAAGNYGWPEESGRETDPRFRAPLAVWTSAIAPGGMAIYDASLFPWEGQALVGGLRGWQLRRVELDRDEDAAVMAGTVILEKTFGRIRAVKVGPDGAIYITTSNRDGRGTVGPMDDLLLRLSPLQETERSAAGGRAAPSMLE